MFAIHAGRKGSEEPVCESHPACQTAVRHWSKRLGIVVRREPCCAGFWMSEDGSGTGGGMRRPRR